MPPHRASFKAITIASDVPSPTTATLYNDAGALKWAGSGIALVPGTTGDLPYNNAGVFAADTGVLTYDAGASTLNVPYVFAVDAVAGGDASIGGGELTAFLATTTAAEGAQLSLSRSRGTYDTPTVVQSGDSLGIVAFYGWDGSDVALGAYLQAVVDGTPGAADMPGRLEFYTSADGSATPTLRLTIKGDGLYQAARTTPMGDWANQAFNAANYTADSGTWTVASGDVTTNRYSQVGKTVTWQLVLVTTTVSGGQSQLRVAVPGGLTEASLTRAGTCNVNENTANLTVGTWTMSGAGYVAFTVPGATWNGTTNTTAVSATIVFEIA